MIFYSKFPPPDDQTHAILLRVKAQTLIFFLVCLPLAALAQASPGYATELKLLAQQRDRELADVTAPVIRRYKDSLNLLLKKATQAGDLPTALKVKEELAKMGEATPNSEISAQGTESIFLGKKWGWFVGDDDHASRHGILEFQEKGVLIKSGEVEKFLTTWEAMPGRLIKVMNKNGRYWVFRYDPAKNEAHSLKEKGSISENDKTLKPVE